MPSLLTHITPQNAQGQRLREYLQGMFPQLPSAKSIRKAIRSGQITVDGKPQASDYRLVGGETIVFQPAASSIPVLALPLPVLYEDDYLAIINKPSGITVSGNHTRTIERALPHNLLPHPSGILPMSVHRLDWPTSGCLLVAKDMPTRITLGSIFAERKVEKVYLAVVEGHPPTTGDIQQSLDGKNARTEFTLVKAWEHRTLGPLALVRCQLHTGRTHQIRKHLAGIGHPLLGDTTYGADPAFRSSLLLHAERLAFEHPVTRETIALEAPRPRRWQKVLQSAKV